MRVKITKSFRTKLNDQVNYIARDKPAAARKFKSGIIDEINDLPKMPFKNRKSIFFDREDIRDLIVKGYVIVYKINSSEDTIEVFGFTKWDDDPSD